MICVQYYDRIAIFKKFCNLFVWKFEVLIDSKKIGNLIKVHEDHYYFDSRLVLKIRHDST